MTIGKGICRVSKSTLIAIRDVIDEMSENYIEYNYGLRKEDEKDYKYKIPSPAGPEEEFKWNGWRNITDYYRYSIDIAMKTYGIKKIEIVEKGKKKTMYKGKFILELRGTVITDYQGRLKGSIFLYNLKNFLDRFVFFKPMDVV